MDELDRAIVGESARWGQPVNGRGGPFFAARPANDFRAWFGGAGGRVDRGIVPPKPGGGGGGKKQFTREDWLAAATAKLTDYFPERTGIVLQQLKEANLYPPIAAPEFGLPTNSGEGLTIENPNPSGTTYYTLDGSDPRLVGGGVGLGAAAYGTPIVVGKPTLLKARILDGATWSALAETTAQPAQDFGGLRITEIHYNPPPVITGDDAEFLELKNAGATPIDLSGATFSAGITYTFPPETVLAPGSFYVIARDAAIFAQLHPDVTLNGIYIGRLANEGEMLTIASANGLTILSVRYDNTAPWPIAANGAGFSLVARKGGDPNDPEYWRASAELDGSPGADDPEPQKFPRVVINELLANDDPGVPALSQDVIELKNLGDAPADISGWYLTNDLSAPAKYRIPDGTIIPANGLVVFRAADFAGSGLVLPSEGGQAWLFSAANGALTGYAHGLEYGAQADGVSFGRVVTSDGREYFPAMSAPSIGEENQAPAESLIRISEIHYAPMAGDDEFVELENTINQVGGLTGAILNGLGYTFPVGAHIPPLGKALVVTIDPAEFRTKHSVPPAVLIYGPAPSPLQENGELVSLEVPVLSDGEAGFLTIDAVRYNDKFPWPSLASTSGLSLQRAPGPNFAGEPRNWLATVPTPGAANSGNFPPEVELTSPLNLSDIVPPTVVHFAAAATDRDGTIAKVEFRVDNEVVGESSDAPYTFDWTPTPGLHDLTARATDNLGLVTESDFVTIDVDSPESGTGRGLHGEYFANTSFSGAPVERDDAMINFDWVEVPPIDGVPRKNFSVRWTGSVVPRRSGVHNFSVYVTGATRLYVNDALVIDGGDESIKTGEIQYFEGPAELTAGHPASVRLEYVDTDGYAHVELRWIEPGEFDGPVIPQTQLYLPGQDPTVLGIATASPLPVRRVARDFRVQLQAANGRRPYAWSISAGDLPEGISLSEAGLLQGAPSTAGLYAFTLQVTDVDGATADKPFELQVVDTSHPELRPVVSIVEPVEDAEFKDDPNVRVRGTVSGSRPVATVEYMVNFGPWHALPETTSWSFVLNDTKGLSAGQNTVTVRAFDLDGRESSNVKRHFRRIVKTPLTVSIDGAGTVTPGFLGVTTRTIGQDYTIVATPAPGWVFKEWRDLFANDRKLTFQMTGGLQLTAVFEPNPYPALAGRYSGILDPQPGFPGPILDGIIIDPPPPPPVDVPVSHANRGAVDFQLTANGAFTVTLRFAGRTYRTRGRFDAFGNFFADFSNSRTSESLYFSLFLLREERQVDAHVTRFSGDIFSESAGRLSVSDFNTAKPCPAAGQYTVRLSPQDDALPPGSGYATLQIKPNGNARFAGELADGSSWSAKTWVRSDLGTVIYSSLYGEAGSLSGTIPFSAVLGERSTGPLFWSRPAVGDIGRFAEGFSGLTDAMASPYTASAVGTSAINLPEGRLALEFGGLPVAIERAVSLTSDNAFIVSPDAGEAIHLSVDPETGVISGDFVYSSGGLTPIRGIVDQFDNSAAGYFLGPNNGGLLRIEPVATANGLHR
jgi:hypothetical protein